MYLGWWSYGFAHLKIYSLTQNRGGNIWSLYAAYAHSFFSSRPFCLIFFPAPLLPSLTPFKGLSHLNPQPRPDIDWAPHWPPHIPSVQSKHGSLTHLYPLLTNQKCLWAANRKMSAFLSSPGRKSVSLKACWETFSSFQSFIFSLPLTNSDINWSLIWLPLC